MVSTVVDEDAVIIRFGGGLNTRASEDEIDPRESSSGQNFKLDARNRELRNRAPFDLLDTAPNGASVRGFASLLKADGSASMLVQAGDTVYEWDGVSLASVGMVNANARLRGRLEANFALNDEVIITDLSLAEPVLVWNGTTLSTMTENLTGDFFAKYCRVSDERAFFANVISNSIATPHMIVGSKRGVNTVLSDSLRPASGATGTDPFFLLSPDLRPINGLVEAFGRLVFSTEQGRIFQLTGADKTDYAIDQLYTGSGANGDEAVVYTGNDVFYGKQGKIESLVSTDKFGDVEADDLTINISDQIEGYTDWTAVYNARLDRVYFFPSGQQEAWVYHKALTEISPWSRWKTQHASDFSFTAAMNCLDPVTGLEYVFAGDSSGNLYRLEGSGAGDGGSASIETSWTSKLFSLQLGGQIFKVHGWIKYRKIVAQDVTVTLTMLYSGEQVFDEAVTITIPGNTEGFFFGGDFYFGGDIYFGTAFAQRITRQKFFPAGKSNDWQVRVEANTTLDFSINEIGLRFETAT